MRARRAEQHAVRDDHGSATGRRQHAQDQRNEQQLGLAGAHLGQQRLAGVLEIERALERRIGQNHPVLPGLRERRQQRVGIADAGVLDSVQAQVHRRKAQHRRVEVEAVEHRFRNVLAVRLQQVARIGEQLLPCLRIGLAQDALGRGIALAQVLHRLHQKPAGAARRIGNRVDGLWATMPTIRSMMWRGVRNWPLMPAVVSLESRYS